jgi:hypothetical protein
MSSLLSCHPPCSSSDTIALKQPLMTINPLTIQPPCPHIHTITALLLPPFSSLLCHPLPPEIIPHPPPAPPVCALYPISSQQFNPFRVVPHNIINTYQLCHQSHAIGYTLVMSLLSSCHHCVTSHTNLLSNAIYLFPQLYVWVPQRQLHHHHHSLTIMSHHHWDHCGRAPSAQKSRPVPWISEKQFRWAGAASSCTTDWPTLATTTDMLIMINYGSSRTQSICKGRLAAVSASKQEEPPNEESVASKHLNFFLLTVLNPFPSTSLIWA